MASFIAEKMMASKIEGAGKSLGVSDDPEVSASQKEKMKEIREKDAERDQYLRERSEKRREESREKNDAIRAK
jgi:predicted secreted Zn-dependent protease